MRWGRGKKEIERRDKSFCELEAVDLFVFVCTDAHINAKINKIDLIQNTNELSQPPKS